MKISRILLVTVLIVVGLSLVPDVSAQIYSGGGLQLPDQSAGAPTEIRGISHEESLINLIIGWTNFLLPFVNVLSIAAIVAAGLMYIVSFTNDELHSKAKSILIYVTIGIVLVYSAFTIVNTLLKVGG
jgi:hypothetical protein